MLPLRMSAGGGSAGGEGIARKFRSLRGALERLKRGGGVILAMARGKLVFLQVLVNEQKLKRVMVEVRRCGGGLVKWMIQVCDQAGAVVTVGIGAGEDEEEAKEKAAGIFLRYFHNLYTRT